MSNLTCQSCKNDYTLSSRTPRLFPNCGHTICSECIQELIDESEDVIRCPEDNMECQFFNKKVGISCFPLNFALYRLLKQRLQTKKEQSGTGQPQKGEQAVYKPRRSSMLICPEHHKPFELVCRTDYKVICSDCILFGSHKGHDYTRSKELQKEIKQKLSSLEHKYESLKYKDMFKNDKGIANDIKSKMDFKKNQLLEEIRDSVESIIDEIRAKEDELRREVVYKFENIQEGTSGILESARRLKDKHKHIGSLLDRIRFQVKNNEYDYEFVLKHLYSEENLFETTKQLLEDMIDIEENSVKLLDKQLNSIKISSETGKIIKMLDCCIEVRQNSPLKKAIVSEINKSRTKLEDPSDNTLVQTPLKQKKERQGSQEIRSLSNSPVKKTEIKMKKDNSANILDNIIETNKSLHENSILSQDTPEQSEKMNESKEDNLLESDIFTLNRESRQEEIDLCKPVKFSSPQAKRKSSFYIEGKVPFNFSSKNMHFKTKKTLTGVATNIQNSYRQSNLKSFYKPNNAPEQDDSMNYDRYNLRRNRFSLNTNHPVKRNFGTFIEPRMRELSKPIESQVSLQNKHPNVRMRSRHVTLGNRMSMAQSKPQRVEDTTELDFSKKGINDYSLPEILSNVAKNKKAKILNLGFNSISDRGFLQLLKRLSTHPSLEKVFLNHNNLQDGLFLKLEAYARKLKKITYFNFAHNSGLKDEALAKKYIRSFRRYGLIVEV